MFKRILVPVDGSDTSKQALQKAVTLAKEQEAQLRVVYVVDVVNINLETERAINEFVEKMRDAGRRILQEAEAVAQATGCQAETALLELDSNSRHIADAIDLEAKRWPADLIVIGTHGRRGLNRMVLGSVADKVVRITTVPVLLIRGE